MAVYYAPPMPDGKIWVVADALEELLTLAIRLAILRHNVLRDAPPRFALTPGFATRTALSMHIPTLSVQDYNLLGNRWFSMMKGYRRPTSWIRLRVGDDNPPRG